MSLDFLRELVEEGDPLNYIKHGAYVDVYDPCCDVMFPQLSKDLSIVQIQNIIWESFYQYFCCGEVGGTREQWALDKEQALIALGHPDRFRDLAFNIRHSIIGI